MEVCGSSIDVCKSFKELRADVYSHTRNTIWLNCHCNGQFEDEYIEAKKLMSSIDNFRKKMKRQDIEVSVLEANLDAFKEDLKDKVVLLRCKCIGHELAYT